jgi:hypothetical protein
MIVRAFDIQNTSSIMGTFSAFSSLFRCEEHLYKRLRWSVSGSVRRSVRPPDARLRGKIIVTSRLIREEEEEEETDYVAIPLRRVLCT